MTLSTLAIGLSIGMLLYIVSAGLTLVFGMLNVVNFAHGSMYMLGAYIGFQAVAVTGSFGAALVLAPLLVALLAGVLEVLTLRPVYRQAHYFQLLLTFGIILVLDEAVRVVWGIDYRSAQAPAWLQGSLAIGDSAVPVYRLFVIGVGLVIAALLHLLLERTVLGSTLKAVSVNPSMASCLGVDIARTRTAVFMAGSALAAFAGVIAAPMLPVYPQMGLDAILDCFVVVILGGLGSLRGAFVAALILGMTRALGQLYLPESINLATYALLVVILLVRPQGLFGVRRRLA